MTLLNFNLEKTYHYLLVSLGFFLPLTVAGGNLIIGIIVLIWLFSGDYHNKIFQIINNRLAVASILFFSVHVVGLIWTEDTLWGLHIVKKMWYFLLLLPILITIVRKENIRNYISVFLLAISITEVFSYLVWFEVIPAFKNASIENPTPFMTHVSYNPILAFSIYLASHEVIFNKKFDRIKTYTYVFFITTMTFNMFITGGRAGQVMYFSMITILIFQYFGDKKKKALIVILTLVPAIFFSAYQAGGLFHERVNRAVNNTINYVDNKESSTGLRITFALNSWELIKENPIIGVGTGDFPSEYKKINIKKTPELPNARNPHNMYVLILAQLGLFGLSAMFYMFYVQFRIASLSKSRFMKDTGLTLPLLFLVIMLSDSYLLGHYTTLMFVFFSSFIYKDFERS